MTQITLIDNSGLDTITLNEGGEYGARQVVLTELQRLIKLAESEDTIGMTVSAVVHQNDNRVEYRNANATLQGDHSQADFFGLSWRHTVSSTVKDTFNRLADQLIPTYVDGPDAELSVGNAMLNLATPAALSDDCMCEDSASPDDEE